MVLLALIGGVLLALTLTDGWSYLTPKGVNQLAEDTGGWAVPAFIGIYSIASFAFVPRGLLALAAGAAFGFPSALYTYAGALIGETLAFYGGRFFGRGFVQVLLGERLENWESRLGGSGFRTIFVLRLIPLVPCDVINYGAGLGSVLAEHGLEVYLAAGDGLVDLKPGPLVFGFGGLVVLGVLPFWLRRRRKAAAQAAEAAEAETNLDPAT